MLIQGSTDNTVGGAIAGARNIISGNGGSGVRIIGSTFNIPDQPPDTLFADRNVVLNNFIGLGSGGDALGNAGDGVRIDAQSRNNTIGGTLAKTGNVISSNSLNGISLVDSGKLATFGSNLVIGNFIGTDDRGSSVGNGQDGVFISGSKNTIGGTAAGQGNVISNNGTAGHTASGNGIHIVGPGAGPLTGAQNVILGNAIGTDKDGQVKLGNARNGVLIEGSFLNKIGGAAAGARNIISGNGEAGVAITGERSSSNAVQGNLIGTKSNGKDPLGNKKQGVLIDGGSMNTVGGAAAGQGNVISGNGDNGVQIQGKSATQNNVQGNTIGTNPAGDAGLGNTGAGVFIGQSASQNLVGGVNAGEANTIANNSGAGVNVDSGNSNGIHRNSIYGNGQKGIILNMANSANRKQAAADPVKAVANADDTTTIVKGLFTSANTAPFSVEIFDNTVLDPAKPQGKTYLATVMAKPTGNANEFAYEVAINGKFKGHFITATVTDADNDTSEFSAGAEVK